MLSCIRGFFGLQTINLWFQGLTNGVENDQNTANLPTGDLSHKRLSTSSTTSNQSYESTNVDYAVPKHSYNQHSKTGDANENDKNAYIPPKITNPLFGVNAASHYAPGSQHIQEAFNEQHKFERPLPNGIRKAPEGQDNDAFKPEDALDGREDVIVSANQINLTETGTGTATYTTDNNGKINVHVTVMINAGNYMHPYESLKHSTISTMLTFSV